MKELEDDSLMKSRSARSVVAAAFRLFSGNFRRLFRASWLAALMYAVVNSVLGTIFVHGISSIALLVIAVLLLIIGGLAELMFYSVGIEMLSIHASTGKMPLASKHLPIKQFWRVLKASLAIFAMEVPFIVAIAALYHYKLATVISEPSAHIVLWIGVGVTILVVALLQLPLLYVAMRYLMNGDMKFWQSLPSSYKVGVVHLGHIFVVVLINAIILIVAHYIITQPAVILEVANVQSQLGTAMGDPSGMPSYMTALCAVTFLLAGFMQAFIRMSFIYSLYYMYGAIETGETEKKQFKTNIE